jgi:ComF family protein
MPLVEHGAPCPYCQGRGLSPFERIVRIGVYQDPLRSLIHRAKYSNEWYLAEQLADRLSEKDETKTLLEQADVLVPVPLHFRRQLQRGYNQAEVIAQRIGAVRQVKVAQAAARCRATESQISLHSRASRVENLKDAFALLRPAAVAGKHVVLVDDVMTSGATLLSLARVLKPAKPASLSALVIAIADPRGHGFETI